MTGQPQSYEKTRTRLRSGGWDGSSSSQLRDGQLPPHGSFAMHTNPMSACQWTMMTAHYTSGMTGLDTHIFLNVGGWHLLKMNAALVTIVTTNSQFR
jgi:hypothetical protein